MEIAKHPAGEIDSRQAKRRRDRCLNSFRHRGICFLGHPTHPESSEILIATPNETKSDPND